MTQEGNKHAIDQIRSEVQKLKEGVNSEKAPIDRIEILEQIYNIERKLIFAEGYFGIQAAFDNNKN